ncbi:MAG: hypothetical protein LBF66_02155 [Holosporales bacterium]|nr:hypothetical protein [Holosporales bacterium]
MGQNRLSADLSPREKLKIRQCPLFRRISTKSSISPIHIPSDAPGFLRDQNLVTSGLVPRNVSREPARRRPLIHLDWRRELVLWRRSWKKDFVPPKTYFPTTRMRTPQTLPQ